MNIAVVGCGFVGGTVADFLEEKGISVVRVDPKYYDTKIEDVVNVVDGIIVAVPTPTNFDTGRVDMAPVLVTCETIANINPNVPILLKSTFPTDQLRQLPLSVVVNPEFLREAHAAEDFRKQQLFILGSDMSKNDTKFSVNDYNDFAVFWHDFFKPLLPNAEFVMCNRETASMIKYAHNAWLATKVAWFHDLHSNLPFNVNWNDFTSTLAKMPNIGPSHMNVPNSEGTYGFGGSCFPKDVKAMIGFTNHEILKKVETRNDFLKKKNVTSHVHFLELVQKKVEEYTEPYIVIIGTSHTFGQCERDKIKAYPDFLSEMLGIPIIAVGNPGVQNIELLQMVMECEQAGLFGDKCMMVLLEPRITDNAAITPWENFVSWPVLMDSIRKRDSDHQMPMLARTNLSFMLGNETRDNNGHHIFKNCINDYLYTKVGVSQLDPSHLKRLTQIELGDDAFKDIDHAALNMNMKSTTFYLSSEKKTNASAFLDLLIIDMIKHYFKEKQIEFGWFVIDNRYHYVKILKEIYKSDIYEDMVVSKGIMEIIHDKLNTRGNMDKIQHLLCSCMHLNEEGGMMAAKILYPGLKNYIEKNIHKQG